MRVGNQSALFRILGAFWGALAGHRIRLGNSQAEAQSRATLGETQNRFSLPRAALITCERAESRFLLVRSKAKLCTS
jgi:hypothetical protein